MRSITYLLIVPILLACNMGDRGIPETFDFGTTENGSYKNDYFDMEIRFDPNWVVQDKQQMNDLAELGGDIIAGEDTGLKSVIKASQVNVAYLLAIFKHDVGAPVEYNPSFLAVAENTKSFPGVKNGADYLFHAKELLQQSQVQYYFEKDVFEKTIGKAKFHVLEAKLDFLGKTIIQEYISTVSGEFSLSFIISYSTEEERNELYEIVDNINI